LLTRTTNAYTNVIAITQAGPGREQQQKTRNHIFVEKEAQNPQDDGMAL